MGSVIVAYSGGIDSTFLSVVATKILGTKTLAVTANSPSLAPSELDNAVQIAKQLNLNHRIIQTDEFGRGEYQLNTPNRCFFCKEELYSHLTQLAGEENYSFVANGTNSNDLGDFRPGIASAKKRGIRSPLVESNLTKNEIRELSKHMDLPNWDKPAQACLASRIPYGTPITMENLDMVSKAEEYIGKLQFNQYRVRHHGTVARIEVAPSEFHKLLDATTRREIIRYFHTIGYTYVCIDLNGFESGSLNKILTGTKSNNQYGVPKS